MCKKIPSDASDLVLPMCFFRLGNERFLGSSLNTLNPLQRFTSPVPALPRGMPENLPQWLQNDMLKNDSNVTSLSQGEEKVNWYVHLWNSTLTTTERTVCWILENYHKEDEVEISKVLWSYMSGKKFIPFQKMSIDLSLEDVKHVSLYYGFVFEKESTIETNIYYKFKVNAASKSNIL
ncbi:Serine--tRNA ligase [Capsicum baccatum]|uniref:Serine--tRNA ligase n=1 Tax=Capsicum baccatum TaxID=33114 RepID=A0A2G2XMH3_CAPBA|nr:Serine--tRNA ligase [Capsicum baccatum]